MLRDLYSFRGRMGRGAFALWSLVVLCVTIIGLCGLMLLGFNLILALANGAKAESQWPPIVAGAVGLVVLSLLPGLALTVKRLRDIGLPPFLCLLVFALFQSFEQPFLAGLMPSTVNDPPPVGLMVDMMFFVLLVLMPGRGAASAATASDESEGSPDWVARAAEIERKMVAERQREALHLARAAMIERPISVTRHVRPHHPMDSSQPAFGRRR